MAQTVQMVQASHRSNSENVHLVNRLHVYTTNRGNQNEPKYTYLYYSILYYYKNSRARSGSADQNRLVGTGYACEIVSLSKTMSSKGSEIGHPSSREGHVDTPP